MKLHILPWLLRHTSISSPHSCILFPTPSPILPCLFLLTLLGKTTKMGILKISCIASIILPLLISVAEARIPGVYSGGSWQGAHATFYGGSDASGTMGTYTHPHTLTSANSTAIKCCSYYCLLFLALIKRNGYILLVLES